ncbi:DNA adenine methylase [Prosthecodimorpha staleyi]|uniref:site-specific DNA-methyltransferase (adenine-specific) n=1 Tax=Prosthecodimorpha staleyi TaxID=2840188 RepID=A0A947GJK9_9HYPH|nr:DNA adenine methylase [Prosthecodimorpha staleyi]MBT9291874.1 DNA adenine methylase [Prosthecodimorpha staleyi]
MVESTRARPAAGYVGGKKQLAGRLAKRIAAIDHEVYAEAFVGMGGVFFRRSAPAKVEVINDRSRDVATFFRILQNHYQAFMDMLRWQLTSRDEFERLNGMDPERLTDLQRAARFLYLQRLSFGGKVAGRTFGVDPRGPGRFNVDRLAPLLAEAHERLAGVWIECLDWPDFLARWDRPQTLFFLDPPYYGTEHYYGRGLFERSDYDRLSAALKGLRGSFVLTLNDHPEVRRIFRGFRMETAAVTYTIGSGNTTRAGELIISTDR